MNIKIIKSEINAGHRALAMYEKVNSGYPVNQRAKDVFEIAAEIERLEELLIKKTQKKAVKWAEKAGELILKSNFDV